MDIKKLDLISTVAMLSVTISLGGCDLFESPQARAYDLTSIKLRQTGDELDKAYLPRSGNEYEAEKNSAEAKKAEDEYNKARCKFDVDSAEVKKAKDEWYKSRPKYSKALAEYKKALAENEKAGAEYRKIKGWR